MVRVLLPLPRGTVSHVPARSTRRRCREPRGRASEEPLIRVIDGVAHLQL